MGTANFANIKNTTVLTTFTTPSINHQDGGQIYPSAYGKLGLNNDLSPLRRQTIIRNNVGLLLIGLLEQMKMKFQQNKITARRVWRPLKQIQDILPTWKCATKLRKVHVNGRRIQIYKLEFSTLKYRINVLHNHKSWASRGPIVL